MVEDDPRDGSSLTLADTSGVRSRESHLSAHVAALERQLAAERSSTTALAAELADTRARLQRLREAHDAQRRECTDLSLRLSAITAERDALAANVSDAWAAAAAAERLARDRQSAWLNDRRALTAHCTALHAHLRDGDVSHFEALVLAARAVAGAEADRRELIEQRRAMTQYAAHWERKATTARPPVPPWRRAVAAVRAVCRLRRGGRRGEVLPPQSQSQRRSQSQRQSQSQSLIPRRVRLPCATHCLVRGGRLACGGTRGAAVWVEASQLRLPATDAPREVLDAMVDFVTAPHAPPVAVWPHGAVGNGHSASRETSRDTSHEAARSASAHFVGSGDYPSPQPSSVAAASSDMWATEATLRHSLTHEETPPAGSAFATEVLRVIQALDQRVLGALERHTRH